MNLRRDLIEHKLTKIVETVDSVKERIPENFGEFKNMGFVKDGIYKRIEFALKSILDICSVINTDMKLGMPETEDSILDNLENKKIFDKKTMLLIREMKKFRNVLVHRYGEINDKLAYETIKDGIDDFEFVIDEIEKFLAKHKK